MPRTAVTAKGTSRRMNIWVRPMLGIFGAPHKQAGMPELPEIEGTRRGLAAHLAGRVISSVEVRQPQLRWPVPNAGGLLPGGKVRAVHRRDNEFLVDFCDGHLILHLGISASLLG